LTIRFSNIKPQPENTGQEFTMADEDYHIGISIDPTTGKPVPPIKQGANFKLTVVFPNVFTDGGINASVKAEYGATIDKPEHTDFTCTIISTTPEFITYDITMTDEVTSGLTPGKGYWDTTITGTIGSDTSYTFKPCGSGMRAIVEAGRTRT